MIDNLVITHVAFHIIKKENTGAAAKANQVDLSEQLLVLDEDSSETLKDRIVAALGEDGESIEMELIPDGERDVFDECCNVLHNQTDVQFLTSSQSLVSILATTQNHPKIPEGAVLIVKGTSTDNNNPCLIILKSEYSNALTTEENEEQLTVKYLEKVFLTGDNKLNKIGFVSILDSTLQGAERNNETNYFFKVFDTNTNRGPDKYATYFYREFLGLQYVATDEILTKRFFYSAKNHILTKMPTPQERFDKMSQLYSYMLAGRRTTINIADFSNIIYENDTNKKREFKADLLNEGVIKNNFQLDKDFVSKYLKARTFLFGDNIKIRIPVGLIVPDLVEFNQDTNSLTLTIKGALNEA